jgi:hypothetical protein
LSLVVIDLPTSNRTQTVDVQKEVGPTGTRLRYRYVNRGMTQSPSSERPAIPNLR